MITLIVDKVISLGALVTVEVVSMEGEGLDGTLQDNHRLNKSGGISVHTDVQAVLIKARDWQSVLAKGFSSRSFVLIILWLVFFS